MNGQQQRIIGYGPPGRTYPHVIVIEAQQPGPHGIDLQIIIDDNLLTDYIRYIAGDQRRRMVKLKIFDEERSLRYADLTLPPGSTDVKIECYDSDDHCIPDLCCVYNLYACSFAPYAPDKHVLKEGEQQEKGARVKYSLSGGLGDYSAGEKLIRQADRSLFARLSITFFDFILLVARCYLGAFLVYAWGGMKQDHHLIGALILGLISTRTLGNTLKLLFFNTGCIVIGIFSPVLGAAFLALRPDLVREIIYSGGAGEQISLTLASYDFFNNNVLYGAKWAVVILLALYLVLWLFSDDEENDDETQS